jgi:alpha-beta hydrolase superfamily lysophospholipase
MLAPVMRTLAVAAFVVHLFCLIWLGYAQRGGPPQMDLVVPGGIPATFYVPGPAPEAGLRFPEPPGAGNGPPAVLLVHGYTADRAAMSVLARRLANAGYGVLAIDVRGHGQNPRPFARDNEGANLFEDLSAAAEWLRASSWVDGTRLAVVGHSMGASAALRFAERDVGVDAAILISGGAWLLGPLRPPNALFIYAANDPKGIRDAAESISARLSGADGGEVGSFAGRDAVRAVEMPGNDHSTILWSAAAAREMIAWLDASLGVENGAEPELAEPRALPALIAAALLPLTLAGIGLALGSVVPAWPVREEGRFAALGGLALALLAALPLVAAAPIAAFLGLDVADVLAGLLFAAGLLLCAGVELGGDLLIPEREGTLRSVLAGGAGFAAIYALFAPIAGLAHDMTPGPGRAWIGVQLALLLFPFFLGFEHCVRRGGTLSSFGLGLAGRVLTLAVIALGVALGVVPFVVTLLFVPLALALLLGEVAAAAIHAAGGNRLASATFQAAFLAWMIASTMPVRA